MSTVFTVDHIQACDQKMRVLGTVLYNAQSVDPEVFQPLSYHGCCEGIDDVCRKAGRGEGGEAQ
jgi:hypothetical protein